MNADTHYESIIQQTLARVNDQVQQGDFANAIAEIHRLLSIDDARLNAGPLSAIINLISITSTLLAAQQAYKEIEPLFVKAINALQAHPDTRPRDYIIPLNNLIVLYESTGNRAALNQVASFMVHVASQLTGPVDSNAAEIFIRLGKSYQRAGDTESVRILYRQVNNYMTSDAQIAPRTRYDWLMMYASFLQQAGATAQALEMLEQAYFLSSKMPDQDPQTIAQLLSAMGSTALSAGALDKAEQYLPLAIQHLEESGKGNSREMSIICHNLASTIFTARVRDRYEEASELVARSLSIVKASGNDKTTEYAGGLGLMANIAARRGDAEQAQNLYHQAFAIYESAADTNKDDFANYLTDAGYFFLHQQDLQQAGRVFDRALNLCQSSPAPDTAKLAQAISNMGLVHFKNNDLDAASEYYTQATDLRHQAMLPPSR